MRQFFLTITLFVVNVGVAQVGVGIETPEVDFDVNVIMKASNLPNVSDQLETYNRVLYADVDGNIGYRQRIRDSYVYRTSYFQKMTSAVQVGQTLTPLNLAITVPILPMKRSLMEINYSIGVINGGTGQGSILISKIENGSETILYQATRTYSFSNGYAPSASAKGIAISNMYYDEVENSSTSVKLVTYKVYGILSQPAANSYSNNIFGMWRKVNDVKNYNWGKGSINITIFDY
ncbi:hypothetical protein [Myroides fluvii]|uniref:hypothetical protein n=1 Tax=Myroides fluvii TaxID=2572594 RepID=UPI00131DB8F9|nr:hypothetical protein [Myroides fluvii]